MKKKSAPKSVMLIMIIIVSIFGIISTNGCKTSDSSQTLMPVPYDIEGNKPK
jgi:hypothetical protein